ncbi:MAG: hypothetical protein ACFFEA_06695 [Candidatus Thorarchaeota archaeon]
MAIIGSMMQLFIHQTVEQLEASEGPWSSFNEFAKADNKKNYEIAYFQLSSAEYTGTAIEFDIKKCLYSYVFEQYGNHCRRRS